MASEKIIPPSDSPNPLDPEAECLPIGPSTRIVVLETDPEGGIFYRFGKQRRQFLQLPPMDGLAPLAIIDMVNLAAFLDPQTNNLTAVAAFLKFGTRVVLLGDRWGEWLDESGTFHNSIDMVDQIYQWFMPVFIDEEKCRIAFDFLINIYLREAYPSEVYDCFREGNVYHSIKLYFDYPTGTFQMARINIHDTRTHRVMQHFELATFPLIWPPMRKTPQGRALDEQKPGDAPRPSKAGVVQAGNEKPALAAEAAATSPETKPEKTPTQNGRKSPPEAVSTKPLPKPIPSTEHLSTHELMAMLSTEHNPDRRWKMIEPNLMQGRPERTYPMILRYPELIAERARSWPPARLKSAFSQQPGAVMIGIMETWHVNQALSVAEDHAESLRIMEWLREREIERLLKVDPHAKPASAETARRILGVDRFADAAAVKKVWRVLLGFINADHGRREERAIHRKKDEIAKLLQEARNVVLRSL